MYIMIYFCNLNVKYIIYLYNLFIIFIIFYKFTLSEVSIIREIILLNKDNANLFVPMSDVLSSDATLSNLISLDSTFSFINISARSRCLIPLVRCGISDAYTHA